VATLVTHALVDDTYTEAVWIWGPAAAFAIAGVLATRCSSGGPRDSSPLRAS
jgi:hypothetical protein